MTHKPGTINGQGFLPKKNPQRYPHKHPRGQTHSPLHNPNDTAETSSNIFPHFPPAPDRTQTRQETSSSNQTPAPDIPARETPRRRHRPTCEDIAQQQAMTSPKHTPQRQNQACSQATPKAIPQRSLPPINTLQDIANHVARNIPNTSFPKPPQKTSAANPGTH